jgi:hypothetical protein
VEPALPIQRQEVPVDGEIAEQEGDGNGLRDGDGAGCR